MCGELFDFFLARDEAGSRSPTPERHAGVTSPAKPEGVKKKKKKTRRSPPPPPIAIPRPTRNRKVPERLIDMPPPAPRKPAPKASTTSKKPAAPKAPSRDPIYLTTNPNSRLLKYDLFHLLAEQQNGKQPAWEILSPTSKTSILNLLPPTAANNTLQARIINGETDIPTPRELSINCPSFRTDVGDFKTNLANGHLTKTWQTQADRAMKDRASGKFDQWTAEESERWWGEDMDEDEDGIE